MEIPLLPCPFCGETPECSSHGGRAWVECENECCVANPQVYADALDSAAWQWNQRYSLDENAHEAGTMRMLREMAQEMGYADTLEALEHLRSLKESGVEALERLLDATDKNPSTQVLGSR